MFSLTIYSLKYENVKNTYTELNQSLTQVTIENMNIEVENDFEEDLYEMVLPEVKGYYEGSQYSKRERYYHHYLNHGQHLYKNRKEAEEKLFGNIKVKDDFNEEIHEKNHPKVKEYMMNIGDWVGELSKRKRYYHHYSKYCVTGAKSIRKKK